MTLEMQVQMQLSNNKPMLHGQKIFLIIIIQKLTNADAMMLDNHIKQEKITLKNTIHITKQI